MLSHLDILICTFLIFFPLILLHTFLSFSPLLHFRLTHSHRSPLFYTSALHILIVPPSSTLPPYTCSSFSPLLYLCFTHSHRSPLFYTPALHILIVLPSATLLPYTFSSFSPLLHSRPANALIVLPSHVLVPPSVFVGPSVEGHPHLAPPHPPTHSKTGDPLSLPSPLFTSLV